MLSWNYVIFLSGGLQKAQESSQDSLNQLNCLQRHYICSDVQTPGGSRLQLPG